jgi:putative membrane protein
VSSLREPHPGALLTSWTLQPIAVVIAAVLVLAYVRAVRRLPASGPRWPAGRSVTFGIGVALYLWSSTGFLQVYQSSLFWVWTTQALVLLLVVPIVIIAGQPLHLARRTARRPYVARVLSSGPARTLANPLVGPAVVPLVSAGLFFGPVAGWSAGSAPAGWALQVLLVVIGALISLPLADIDEDPSSLAVGLALAIGSFELVLDAIPGIALRLHTTVATTFFDHRQAHPWSPAHLHDQQTAGTILWCLAEVIDLPFLLLVYRRWLRADARDAAAADAVLEAERAARGALPDAPGEPTTDEPWWLSDPSMRRRFTE